MPIELHGFGTGGAKKIAEDVGHFVFGLLPLDLLWWMREWTTVRLPWFLKGQWPPGDVEEEWLVRKKGEELPWYSVPLDRVSDSARDELGRSLGAQLRPLLVVALTLWAVGWW